MAVYVVFFPYLIMEPNLREGTHFENWGEESMKKRILSTLLTICMVLTLLPINVLADFSIVDGAIQGQVFGAASGTEGPVGKTVNAAVYAQDNPNLALASCTTDADGVFTLTKEGGFPAGNYTVVLTSSLYLTERKEISISSGSSGYTFSRIDLRVLGKVYGTVTDSATGAALSGVKVEAYRNSVLIASTTTDALGAYSMEGERGECQLVLSKDGYTSKTVDTKFSGPIGAELVDVEMTATGGGNQGGGSGEQGGGNTGGETSEIIASGDCGATSDDHVTWTLDKEGVLTIDGIGNMFDYGYYKAMPWYSYKSNIQSLIIKSGVTSIGGYAFYGCNNLNSVIIHSGVTCIENYAFKGCNGLTSVTIPDSVTSIGVEAFSDCSNLTSIIIPEGVTKIDGRAFENCNRLTEIKIPSSVDTIGWYAFSGCTSLTNVAIAEGVCSIGESMFYNCSNLISVAIPNTVTRIESSAFFGCESLVNVPIPSNATYIGGEAFRECANLASLVIPNICTVEDGLFMYSAIQKVTVLSSNISAGMFMGCHVKTLIISDVVLNIGASAFQWSEIQDIYYAGSKEQWSKISIQSGNEDFGSATIHYNSTGPDSPENPDNPDHFYETQNPVTDTKSLLNSYVEDWNAAYTKYVEAVDKALQVFASDSAPNRDEVIQSQKLAMMEADSRTGSRDARYLSGSGFPDDEVKNAAYEALSTFLYDHTYSAIDLSNISAEDINGTKLVRTIQNAIRSDSETYQIGHVKVSITTSGIGNIGFGMLTCTSQRIAGRYTYGICSSQAKCEQAIRAYMRELVGLENSAIYQVYSAVCKDVLGQSLDKLTQNYLKTKLQPLLSKIPPKVGSLMTDLNSCYNYYQYVKKIMGWAQSADAPENILAAMQGIEFKDESIQDKGVKKTWKALKKAASNLNDAYMCYLSGTLDESKIVTWWNNTVEWWSNETAKIKAIFTCPVNVSVYSSSGQQIGYVGDDDIWYTDGLIYIEEKGDAKIVYSFTDDLISFQLSATDYGSLGCSIEEYDEAGHPTGRTNYYDIELYPSKTLSVLGSRDGENTSYKITAKNNVIDVDEYIPSSQNAAISVRCSATSGGTISGAGSYVRGDAVVLLAEPEKENRFIGWYQGEDLLSTSRVYEFTARENIELKAVFHANTSEELEAPWAVMDWTPGAVTLAGPAEKLSGVRRVWAAAYDGRTGRLTETVAGEMDGTTVRFPRWLDKGWRLFFLDASGRPLAESAVLTESGRS